MGKPLPIDLITRMLETSIGTTDVGALTRESIADGVHDCINAMRRRSGCKWGAVSARLQAHGVALTTKQLYDRHARTSWDAVELLALLVVFSEHDETDVSMTRHETKDAQ